MDNLGDLFGGLVEGIFGGAAEAAPEFAADAMARTLSGESSAGEAADVSGTRYLVGGPRPLGINDL